MIKTREIQNYKNYGTCISLSNGLIDLYVTVDVGPRIVYLSRTGKENIMFDDVDNKYNQDVSSLYPNNATWHLYGGHRLSISPEDPTKSYYPDNNKVVYEYTQNGVILTPPIQDVTGLLYKIEITLDEELPKVNISHIITNTSKDSVKVSAMGSSAMDASGMIIAPLSDKDTGIMPNRHIVLWPFTDINDSRLILDNKFIGIKNDSPDESPLKISYNDTMGKVAYINHDQAFIKSYPTYENDEYPDFNTNCELYSCSDYIELSSLSPLKTLQNGETLIHNEEWNLLDNISIESFTKESILDLFNMFK